MIKYPPIRSQESETRCFLRFLNSTERSVNIVWINFSGKFVSYKTLNKDQFVDVNTFKTHPWIAFDDSTQDRLHIDKRLVYYPQTFREYYAERFPKCKKLDSVGETRILLRISLPVHSLKYTVLLFLKNYLNNTVQINELDLPQSLAYILENLIEERKNLQQLPLNRVAPSNIP